MRLWKILTCLCLLFLTLPAYGIDSPDEMLQNPQQEKRAEAIGARLRCLVCQNESIEDSSAGLAKDLRKIVRQHVQAGETDQQIMNWMVDRYGTFIRLNPPFTLATLFLWVMPFLALGIGCLAAFLFLKKRQTQPPPLSPEEQKRLNRLMKDVP